MIMNNRGPWPTRSENAYFANNEQASLAVFTVGFCYAHAENNLIRLKLYNNWPVQAVNNISECAIWDSSKPIKFAHV